MTLIKAIKMSIILSILLMALISIIGAVQYLMIMNGQQGLNTQIGLPFPYFNGGDAYYEREHYTGFFVFSFIGDFLIYFFTITPIVFLFSKILDIFKEKISANTMIIRVIAYGALLSIVLMGIISVAQNFRNKDLSASCSIAQGIPYSKGWNPHISCNDTHSIGFPFTFFSLEGGSFGAVLDLPHTVYNIPALIGDFLIFFTVIFSIVYVTFRTRSKDIQSQSY